MKVLTLVFCVLASVCVYADANRNSVFIGVDAGGNSENIDRSVFIGSAAGWEAGLWPDGMNRGWTVSNLFMGAAAGLRGYGLDSNVGMGYRAFRMARQCANCVGVGAGVFADAVGATNEVNINNQFFISPTNIWIKTNPNSEHHDVTYDRATETLDVHYVKCGGVIIGNMDVYLRILAIEQHLGIAPSMMMSAPPPNTPTNAPMSGD